MSIPEFGTPDKMRDLLQRLVRRVGLDSNDRVPLWSHVGKLFGHGSGYSAAICKEFGADPDELIGGLKDEQYCNSCGFCQSCLHHEYEECSEDCEA